MPPRRTGVLIVRTWLEDQSDTPLRVHLRFADDVATGVERSMYAGDVPTVVAAVENWLLAMAGESMVDGPELLADGPGVLPAHG